MDDDLSRKTILQMKYARIIQTIAKLANIDSLQAMDWFYNSETLKLMDAGIADLHCRSDFYLAEEIISENKF